MTASHDLARGVALLVVSTAALTDHRTGRIPNWLTLGALIAALGVGWLLAGLAGLGSALLGALLAGCGPLLLYLASQGRHLGGGDVKLLFTLGAWLGPTLALESTAIALVGLLGFALATRQRGPVRLGPALALGTWARCTVPPALALLSGAFA